ncbi:MULTISPECIES: acyltransferase [Microcoleaceae]|uniref:acyltransferase n=1 Tax=Microcoleaceae TaxID=1892252 RepID=UPI002237D6E7|nr:acyltransferase [Lyngbya sp. CCAP 1446/10]
MIKSTFQKILRHFAMRYGKFRGLYVKFCEPSSEEYTQFLRLHGNLYSIGENCTILPSTVFTDPTYVRIGNNVHFSTCTLIGHDGSIAMLNQAYNVKLDAVGKIDIRDNVFIGYNSLVLRNVTIGPNAIVAAGAVVTKDVAEGDIVAGVPAKPIGRVADLVEKWQAETQSLPWADLINSREGAYDPEMEPQLTEMRLSYFYRNK